MKRICFIFIFIAGYAYSQDYMNVEFSTGYKYAHLDNISKITFNTEGTLINFELTSGSISTESVDDIVKIVFASEAMGDEPLPVELVSFSAHRYGNQINLYWETASEIENLGFEIQRNQDNGNIWEKIGFVEGNGSVSTTSKYTFTDNNVTNLDNLKYRLKQIDYNGNFKYSIEISVTNEEITEENTIVKGFNLSHNFPNPFNPETTIPYEIDEENITSLIVYDVLGKEVEVLVNKNQIAGKYEIKFNGIKYPSGIYFCKLTSGGNNKLIKMILVK